MCVAACNLPAGEIRALQRLIPAAQAPGDVVAECVVIAMAAVGAASGVTMHATATATPRKLRILVIGLPPSFELIG